MALSGVTGDRRFDFFYEDFCDNPCTYIKKIENFLKKNGCVVKRKAIPPKKFTKRNVVNIDQKLYERMVEYIEK